MRTTLLPADHVDEAVALLKAGHAVAVPTETVYGLAADARNEDALHKIFVAKNRPRQHPLIVHISSLEQAEEWAEVIPEDARILAHHFWPGPLTMIFKKNPTVSHTITGGMDTVALRVPNHPLLIDVIRKLRGGIAAPSANAHKRTSPTTARDVLVTLEGKIPAILDGGACTVGIESTIVDMSRRTPAILRPGAITKEMIEGVLDKRIERPAGHTERVPGNMKAHYQPEKPLYILSKESILDAMATSANIAVIHHSALPRRAGIDLYPMSLDKAEYARRLYQELYRIDATKVTSILVETLPQHDDWADLHDRLLKAAVSPLEF